MAVGPEALWAWAPPSSFRFRSMATGKRGTGTQIPRGNPRFIDSCPVLCWVPVNRAGGLAGSSPGVVLVPLSWSVSWSVGPITSVLRRQIRVPRRVAHYARTPVPYNTVCVPACVTRPAADKVAISTSRSGGPGGQNVNKLNTKVTLRTVPPGCPLGTF